LLVIQTEATPLAELVYQKLDIVHLMLRFIPPWVNPAPSP